MNTSDQDADILHTTSIGLWNIVLSGFYILIFIIAIPGNILALWAFCHQKSSSPSKIFLRNLSIADLCYVLILPMRIVYHFSDTRWPFGYMLCQLSGFLFYLNMYSSLYLMGFINLDRMLAVVKPIEPRRIRKTFHANVAVVILWITVIVSMSPTLFSRKNQNNSSSVCTNLYLEESSPKALVSTIVAFLLPLITIIVSYTLILLKLRRLKRQEQRTLKDKVIKMIALIVTNFLLAFMPYHICRVVYIQNCSPVFNGTVNHYSLRTANQITSALTCISGVVDPVMYFVLNHAYKDTFLKLFCKNRKGGRLVGSKITQRSESTQAKLNTMQ